MCTAYKYKKVKQLLILVESDIFYNQLQALLLSTITTHNTNTNKNNNSTINIHKSHKNKHNTTTHIHTNIHTHNNNSNTNSNACYSHISTILLDKTRSLFQEFEIVKIDKIYKENNYKVKSLAYNFYNSINNNNSTPTTSTNTVPTTLKIAALTATATPAYPTATANNNTTATAAAATTDANAANDTTKRSCSSKMSPLVPTLPLTTTSTTSTTTLSAKAPPFTSRTATASDTSLPPHAYASATPADKETGLSFPVTATSDTTTCDQTSYVNNSVAKSSCCTGTDVGAGAGLSFPPTAPLLENTISTTANTQPIVTPTPTPDCPSPPLSLEEGMHRLALGYVEQEDSHSSRHSNSTPLHCAASVNTPNHSLPKHHDTQQGQQEELYSARSSTGSHNSDRSAGTVNWGYGGS